MLDMSKSFSNQKSPARTSVREAGPTLRTGQPEDPWPGPHLDCSKSMAPRLITPIPPQAKKPKDPVVEAALRSWGIY
jgi:hypothetical protein